MNNWHFIMLSTYGNMREPTPLHVSNDILPHAAIYIITPAYDPRGILFGEVTLILQKGCNLHLQRMHLIKSDVSSDHTNSTNVRLIRTRIGPDGLKAISYSVLSD